MDEDYCNEFLAVRVVSSLWKLLFGEGDWSTRVDSFMQINNKLELHEYICEALSHLEYDIKTGQELAENFEQAEPAQIHDMKMLWLKICGKSKEELKQVFIKNFRNENGNITFAPVL